MTPTKIGVVAVCISCMSMVLVGYLVHRDLNEKLKEDTPGFHVAGKPTIGDERFALLQKLTRSYVASHADVPAKMKDGNALAPVAFLNHELELNGEKWRVRDVRGLVADTYNVM